MPRQSNRWFAAAWIIFVLSLFLPAAPDMEGWRCAVICAALVTELNDWATVYYFVFTIPNLLMLLSPLLIFWINRKTRMATSLIVAAIFCFLYVLSFGFINWFSEARSDLKVGYYMWLASFAFLVIGVISMGRKPTVAHPQSLEITA